RLPVPVPIGTLAWPATTRRGSWHDGTTGTRGLGRRAHPRTHRPVPHPASRAPAGSRGVGGGLRDRAARRGGRPHLPPPPHPGLRGLDDLALPPDRLAH